MPWIRARPGDGPRRLVRRWQRRRAFGALLVATATIFAVLGAGPVWWWIVVAAPGLWVWHHGATRVRRAHSGVRGERGVAEVLGRWAVATYGWSPPGSRADVDVVVTWPSVVAIEVKHAAGRVRVGPDGTVVVGGSRLAGAPIRQAVRGAASVRRRLGLEEPVGAILCVTGMRQRPQWVDGGETGVILCSQRHLRRVLRRLPRSDRREARALVRELVTAE